MFESYFQKLIYKMKIPSLMHYHFYEIYTITSILALTHTHNVITTSKFYRINQLEALSNEIEFTIKKLDSHKPIFKFQPKKRLTFTI